MPRKRGHGEGSFYQTTSGLWRGAITVRRPDGTRGRVYVSGRTKRAAMAAAARRREDLERTGPRVDRTITVAAYLDQWLTDVAAPSVKASTLTSYRGQLARVKRELGGYRLVELRHAHVQAAYRRIGGHPATLRAMHSTFSTALRRAVIWELIPANPADGVALPRVDRVARPVLTPEQAEAFIAAARGAPFGALWTLLLTTGLRYGEALGLTWPDVDLDGGSVTVCRQLKWFKGEGFRLDTPKTASAVRSEPLTGWAVTALRERRTAQLAERLAAAVWANPDDLVFTMRDGGAWSHSTINRYWRQFRARLGLPPAMRMHDLRHSYASLLTKAGVHPRVAADLMGHASPVLTLGLYTHTSEEQHREAIHQLERRIGGANS